jgi:hypothetical protein
VERTHPKNFCAVRFETDGAETQLSPTTMPRHLVNSKADQMNDLPERDNHAIGATDEFYELNRWACLLGGTMSQTHQPHESRRL